MTCSFYLLIDLNLFFPCLTVGFECHNRTTRRCSKCETRKAHIYNLKDPFPFPSLANYSALLLGTTTFSACSACDSGIQSSYDKVVNNLTCKELPVTIGTPRLEDWTRLLY